MSIGRLPEFLQITTRLRLRSRFLIRPVLFVHFLIRLWFRIRCRLLLCVGRRFATNVGRLLVGRFKCLCLGSISCRISSLVGSRLIRFTTGSFVGFRSRCSSCAFPRKLCITKVKFEYHLATKDSPSSAGLLLCTFVHHLNRSSLDFPSVTLRLLHVQVSHRAWSLYEPNLGYFCHPRLCSVRSTTHT